ncbi:uncharacterized protein H6S33_005651 [Morchella sextelata]|uniref:uncharacterized protein n=1 Tax=Morchella sextelata TaxID=1174677 RepID=UPI001D04A49C|nr:uncharacterized protein H6S33_005651 [Morchella sextelata]KAH0613765.1 hypothetical protein H6S33_005651 [Morchella sextelata]
MIDLVSLRAIAYENTGRQIASDILKHQLIDDYFGPGIGQAFGTGCTYSAICLSVVGAGIAFEFRPMCDKAAADSNKVSYSPRLKQEGPQERSKFKWVP